MLRRHELIASQAMGRPMHLWRYGHYGVPVLVLPSAAGMAHEWEYNGLVDALSGLLEAGRIKLYCSESNVSESWTAESSHPAERIRRHQAFERYVVGELVPKIRHDCRTEGIRLALAGTSLGAFYAATLALKFPETFFYALCMSGRYDPSELLDGFASDDVYFNNPMAFLPHLSGHDLERVRSSVHLDLVCGEGRFEGTNGHSTTAFATLLRSKGISHRRDLWGPHATHEPVWWTRQAAFYLARRFGGHR